MANPLTHPLFYDLMLGLIPLVVGGLGVVLFVERTRLGQLRNSSLFKQWAAGSVLGIITTLCVLTGGLALAALVLAAIVVGVLEYSSVTKLGNRQRNALLICGAVMLVATVFGGTAALPAVLAFSFITVAIVSMMGSDGTTFATAAIAGLGVFYVPFLGVHVYLLSSLNGGAGLLLTLVASTALSDIGAFAMGKMFGKKLFKGKKLAPALSPNKTWAGVIGSFIGAYAGFIGLSLALSPMPLLALIVMPVMVVITGISGDLFESLMKRSFGVKDAGKWLPGFGGALDRVDAMLFVMPAAFYFVTLFKLVG